MEKPDGEILVKNPFYTPDRINARGERELISKNLRKILQQNEEEFATRIAQNLVNASLLEGAEAVPAIKVVLDRIEGPIERVLKHQIQEGQEKRLVIDPTLLPERALLGLADPQPPLNGNGHTNGHSNGNGSHGS